MAYTALTAAQTDADSPLNQTLFDLIRTNSAHFATAIDATTAEIETDKVTQDSIAASAVGVGELIIGSEEQSTGVIAAPAITNLTFSSITAYGHYPRTKYVQTVAGSHTYEVHTGQGSSADTNNVFVNRAIMDVTALGGGGQYNFFVNIAYHQASPPHYLGEIEWGGAPWVYVLRENATEEIKRAWRANDPPCYLHHGLMIRDVALRAAFKRNPLACALRPHPFVDDFPEIPAGHTVELLDLRHLDEPTTIDEKAYALSKVEAIADVAVQMGLAADDPMIIEHRLAIQAVKSPKVRTIPLWEKLELDALMGDGPGILAAVHDGTLPGLDTMTRSLSDDAALSDNAFLPRVPGLFKPDGATPPTIRVMTQQ